MDDTDEMAGNECEHFSAWKLKKHLELLQKVSINSILKGFILTMLQALKDHQFLHDNYNAQQLHMEYMKGSERRALVIKLPLRMSKLMTAVHIKCIA